MLLNLSRFARAAWVGAALLAAAPGLAQSGTDRVFPNGARPGETVTLTFPALSDEAVSELVVDGPGVKALGPFTKGVGMVAVAPDAVPGMRQIRLVGARKSTTPRPFLIDPTPALLDVEVGDKKAANDRLDQAQRIEALPVVLCGSLAKSQDIDVFRLKLNKGDCLVVASVSRRIAAPTNLGVYLRDLHGRRVPLELDYRKSDPLYWGVVPADGEYQLQLFEVTNNMGDVGEQTLYRVHVTTGPWLDYLLPPGGPRGIPNRVTAYGWNWDGKPGAGSTTLELPPTGTPGTEVPAAVGSAPNAVPFVLGESPEADEKEPNNETPAAQALALPVTVNGGFQARGDVDRYRITLKSGERLRLTVRARSLDSRADVVLRLLDTSGKTLLVEDDPQASRDPEVFFTARADGDYILELREIAGGSHAGPSFFYRLEAAPAVPRLRLVAREAVFTAKPGTRAEVPLTLVQDYQPGEVSLEVEGFPDGVTAELVKLRAAPDRSSSTQAKLVLVVGAGAKPGYGMIRVIAKSADPTVAAATATWALTGDGGWTYGTGTTDRLVLLIPPP